MCGVKNKIVDQETSEQNLKFHKFPSKLNPKRVLALFDKCHTRIKNKPEK